MSAVLYKHHFPKLEISEDKMIYKGRNLLPGKHEVINFSDVKSVTVSKEFAEYNTKVYFKMANGSEQAVILPLTALEKIKEVLADRLIQN